MSLAMDQGKGESRRANTQLSAMHKHNDKILKEIIIFLEIILLTNESLAPFRDHF
jgi:hypothetical protein